MPRYKHFSYEERAELARMLHQGVPKTAIADKLARHRSSIDREIGRNRNKDGSYNPETGQRRYQARRRRGCILDRVGELAAFVVEMLHENWTPGQIAGWLKGGHEKGLAYVSHETIYQWIYSAGQRAKKLWKLCPGGGQNAAFARPARPGR